MSEIKVGTRVAIRETGEVGVVVDISGGKIKVDVYGVPVIKEDGTPGDSGGITVLNPILGEVLKSKANDWKNDTLRKRFKKFLEVMREKKTSGDEAQLLDESKLPTFYTGDVFLEPTQKNVVDTDIYLFLDKSGSMDWGWFNSFQRHIPRIDISTIKDYMSLLWYVKNYQFIFDNYDAIYKSGKLSLSKKNVEDKLNNYKDELGKYKRAIDGMIDVNNPIEKLWESIAIDRSTTVVETVFGICDAISDARLENQVRVSISLFEKATKEIVKIDKRIPMKKIKSLVATEYYFNGCSGGTNFSALLDFIKQNEKKAMTNRRRVYLILTDAFFEKGDIPIITQKIKETKAQNRIAIIGIDAEQNDLNKQIMLDLIPETPMHFVKTVDKLLKKMIEGKYMRL